MTFEFWRAKYAGWGKTKKTNEAAQFVSYQMVLRILIIALEICAYFSMQKDYTELISLVKCYQK